MRTKTLLTAFAALAAGLITSKAQVYSANVVGYATMTLPSSFSLLTVPFQVGTSNGANEIFGSGLPDGTQLYLWDQAHGKFVIDVYDTGAVGPSQPWVMSDDATPTNTPTLPVGQGFFLLPASPITNTFAGVVAVNVGATNTTAVPSSFALLGSVIPAAGSVSNSVINLNGLPDGTQLYLWDQTHGKYIIDVYDTGAVGPDQPWVMSDDATPTNTPSIAVGQGFFLLPASPYSWKETLSGN